MSIREWINRPMRPADRLWAIIIGLIGGFWLGLIVRLSFGPMPVSFQVLGYWIIGGMIVGGVLGYLFPRVVSIILYPFTLLGIGSN
jgi:hypothetical protein